MATKTISQKALHQILITNNNPTKIKAEAEFDETYNIWRVKVELRSAVSCSKENVR